MVMAEVLRRLPAVKMVRVVSRIPTVQQVEREISSHRNLHRRVWCSTRVARVRPLSRSRQIQTVPLAWFSQIPKRSDLRQLTISFQILQPRVVIHLVRPVALANLRRMVFSRLLVAVVALRRLPVVKLVRVVSRIPMVQQVVVIRI